MSMEKQSVGSYKQTEIERLITELSNNRALMNRICLYYKCSLSCESVCSTKDLMHEVIARTLDPDPKSRNWRKDIDTFGHFKDSGRSILDEWRKAAVSRANREGAYTEDCSAESHGLESDLSREDQTMIFNEAISLISVHFSEDADVSCYWQQRLNEVTKPKLIQIACNLSQQTYRQVRDRFCYGLMKLFPNGFKLEDQE